MQCRSLGRTGWNVSSISFGTWAVGAEWGAVNDQESLAALHRALDKGVNFFDTADVYGYMPEVFEVLDDLTKAGKLRHYGVSVEKVEEALKAIEYPTVQTVQIIFNMFRQRPRDLFFAEAQRRQVGILARLPLSSGMLSGKLTANSHFAANDHRAFNRHGESFDRGETFSGLDYDIGLQAVEALRPHVPAGTTMAEMALRWILMFPAVTCAIPGAKRPDQVDENLRAADLPPLSDETMSAIEDIYNRQIRSQVHHYW